MARLGLSDDLWPEIAPLLPLPRSRSEVGLRPIEILAALTGILFVLLSGVPWEMLPVGMACGRGIICFRRLRERQAAGVSARLHQVLFERLHVADEIGWWRVS